MDVTASLLLTAQLKKLKEAGYEVHVTCSSGKYSSILIENGFQLKPIRFIKHVVSLGHLKSIFELYQLMRHEKYDIVHVHNVITAFLGRIAAKLARVPIVIYTLHGFYFHENMTNSVRVVNVLLERLGGRITDLILSQADEDRVTAINERIIEADKVRTIGNGVNIDRFSKASLFSPEVVAQIKQELNIPPAATVIGTVGRIVEEKGFREFFEAGIKIIKHYPEAVFLVVGDTLDSDRGKFSEQLKTMIRENKVESKFYFTGFQLETERFYPVMNVFVLPSYREGMPRTVIEAMVAARPVVASNIRGCREEIINGETGFLVPVKNSQALAKAIIELLENPEMARQMGKAGQQRAGDLFDERLVCERILIAYQKMVSDKLNKAEVQSLLARRTQE